MDSSVANALYRLAFDAHNSLHEATALVASPVKGTDEYEYKKRIAAVMFDLYSEVLKPLRESHPRIES